jgi:polynucleotide 5'-hydroxyl-kinase GRC3/NOL9
MVAGGVDSGKSSFCTYLINKLISEKCSVAVLDCDIGQSDVGPPCTVAYAFVTKPVTDLFDLKAENATFVGVTSPSEDVNKTIKGAASLKTEASKRNVDFVVVNTDGWVAEEEAVDYKVQLAEKLSPDVIFGIQQNNELETLLAKLEGFRKIRIDSALAVKERSKEKRKTLRELGYVKYLTNSKVRTWRLSRLNIEKPNPLCLRQKPEDNQQKGLLLGLHDAQKKFLGIGILQGIDYERKSLKVFTSVTTTPVNVAVGKVRLDDKLREIPT